MRTNTLFAVAALSVTTILSTGCSIVSPDAGHEAVLVAHPLIFGHGGVVGEPVSAGTTLTALTTTSLDVNMQPEQHELPINDLMTSDGVPLDFDAIVRLQVTNSVQMIQMFGPNWYKNNIEREFANLIRQAVRTRGMNETAINTTAIAAIDREVAAGLTSYVHNIRMPLNLIDVTVGKANPPDSVKSQRIQTAQQEQRIITEQQIKLAEDSRKAAEQSRAEADNAYRNAMGLSPEQFIQLENINMQREVCARNHCTFIVGHASPVIDTK